jgi:cellulose synthase/poly-beta-1,6-N-acetylglucosamine synthase-like glycosyltransferase
MVAVEVLYLGNLMVPLFLIQSSAYRTRSRQVDELLASGVTDSPSVDLVVQATKQPMRLIRRALLSSLDLGCKPRSITVVDENCREEIRDLAQGLGARYVVQSLPLSAADLHSSLSGSGAELIAAFDASCMPLKSFLTRTTALFRDQGVAMVQTPQALFHSEDYNRNLGAEVVMPPNRSYSSFFLEVLRDQRNAILGSGGSAVVRRSALLELDLPLPLGTHQARQTSLGLLAGGWRIAYLPEMLSIGEAPRCFADYLDRKLQRIHADLLLIPTALSKATWGNLGTWQKGLILNHLVDQFSPLFRIAYLVMPLVALTAGFSLVNASLLDFIGYRGLPGPVGCSSILADAAAAGSVLERGPGCSARRSIAAGLLEPCTEAISSVSPPYARRSRSQEQLTIGGAFPQVTKRPFTAGVALCCSDRTTVQHTHCAVSHAPAADSAHAISSQL